MPRLGTRPEDRGLPLSCYPTPPYMLCVSRMGAICCLRPRTVSKQATQMAPPNWRRNPPCTLRAPSEKSTRNPSESESIPLHVDLLLGPPVVDCLRSSRAGRPKNTGVKRAAAVRGPLYLNATSRSIGGGPVHDHLRADAHLFASAIARRRFTAAQGTVRAPQS